MRIWVTKWALTAGVMEHEAIECPGFPGMVEVPPTEPGTMKYTLHGEGKEWHRTEQDAIRKAIEMGDKKIAAIKRQIKRIEMTQAGWRNRRDALRNQA
jgi:hypothetical protein